jgi:hypothetical protein
MSVQLWCPRCGQGWVGRWRVPGGTAFWGCEECESVWFNDSVGPTPDGGIWDLPTDIAGEVQWSLLTRVVEDLVERCQTEET